MMMDGYFNEYVPMIEYHLLNIQYTIQTDPNLINGPALASVLKRIYGGLAAMCPVCPAK